MKYIYLTGLLVFGVAAMSGCVTGGSQKTALELQAFQKKEFSAPRKVVFGSVMSVFQDMGYTVKQASIETGFVQASSPTKNILFFGSHMSSTDATAFIEELNPSKTSVRLNFVLNQESSSGYGMKAKADKPVVDPKVYEVAFEKVQEAIFVRKAGK
jgi:hypothetical protein